MVVRKIYNHCDTKTKWSLNEVYFGIENNVLKRSGCLDNREEVYCFICQNNIFYNDFWRFIPYSGSPIGMAHSTELRSPLGYLFYVGGRVFVDHQHRHNTLRDNILKYFEISLENVFKTTDLDDLRNHLVENHAPHNYFPTKYWADMDQQVRHAFYHNDHFYRRALRTRALHKKYVPQLVCSMFKQLAACHAIGNKWKPIFLDYGKNQLEIVPEFKAIQSFNLWLYTIEQQTVSFQKEITRKDINRRIMSPGTYITFSFFFY